MPFKSAAARAANYARWCALNKSKLYDYGVTYRKRHPELVQKRRKKWETENSQYRLEYGIQWAKNHPESRYKTARKILLRNKYGLTQKQFDELLTKQKNACAICGKKFDASKVARRACVDHCGKAGHVRALLCTNCNSGIAMLGHSTTVALKAAKYLSKETLFNGE